MWKQKLLLAVVQSCSASYHCGLIEYFHPSSIFVQTVPFHLNEFPPLLPSLSIFRHKKQQNSSKDSNQRKSNRYVPGSARLPPPPISWPRWLVSPPPPTPRSWITLSGIQFVWWWWWWWETKVLPCFWGTGFSHYHRVV